MLFADHYVMEWAGAIGGSITAIGGAILGLYILFRKNKTTADEADSKADRAARQEQITIDAAARQAQINIDAAAMQRVVDDLRKDNESLRTQMGVIQSSTLVKIIEAHDECHDCEKKYATLETKYTHLEGKYKDACDEIKALKEQLSKKEGK